jgi:predicted permease
MMSWMRHTMRRLRQARAFSIAAFLTLTLGMASATTVFSVVDAVLLRPLPYPASDRLVSVSHTLQVGGTLRVDQSDASLIFYGRHNRAFAAFGGYAAGAAALGPARGADAERVADGRVTSGALSALAVTPISGRLFAAEDDRVGAPPVVILSERLWTRRYGRDPGILHQSIDVDGVPHEVIGILPDTVRFPETATELWLPLVLDPARTDSASFDYQAVARLRRGTTMAQAEEDLQSLLVRLPDELPGRLTRGAIEQTRMRVVVQPLAEAVIGNVAPLLWIVLGAAGFVLMAACANVACLLLVRAEERRRTFAIQRVLGAPAAVPFAELIGEMTVLAGGAAVVGLAMAAAAARAIRAGTVALDLPRLTEVRVDATVVLPALIATAAGALGIGAFAAWRSRPAATGALASLTPAATAGRRDHRMRYALVAAQIAVAMLLVVGSCLMARSLWRLRHVPPGFEPAGALTFHLALPASSFPANADAVRFVDRVLEDVSRLPGVRAAGAASKLPLEEQAQTETAVFVEDRPRAPGALPRIHPIAYVSPGYFAAMGIPIVEGDRMRTVDPANLRLDAVVSRAFASRYWPGETPIGKRIRILIDGPWYTVVGVAGDVRDAALDRPADELIYCPLLPPSADRRWAPRDLAFVVRTDGDPVSAGGAIRGAVRALDASLPLYRTRRLSALVAAASARRELVLALVGAASGIALLLGAIGLYGVMSYVVSLRTREIGIRLALGEAPAHLEATLTRGGVTVALAGVAVGLASAAALGRVLGAFLFEVRPSDPLVFAVSALVVLVLAATAAWIPGRRAAGIDPARALRSE